MLLDAVLFSGGTPAERRAALDAFCKAAPENAIGDYLSALEHFESGNSDAGVSDMWRAIDKTWMDDYLLETVQAREELYVTAGASREQAAAVAYMGAEMPQAAQLRALSRRLLELEGRYAAVGDSQSARAIAEIGVQLGTRVQEQLGHVLLNDLVGMAIERGFLQRLDPNDVLVAGNQTVAERLVELDRQKKTISETASNTQDVLLRADDRELMNYVERAKLYGELNALQWLQERHTKGNVSQ